MGLSQHGYLVLVYCLVAFVVTAFFLYAMVCSYVLRRKNDSVEAFITARGQVSCWRIGWSFYAAAVGAWVINSPASYSPFAGVIGCVFYALASGFPIVVIAYVGSAIQRKVPHVLSLTDFIGWRFGMVSKLLVVAIICFTMSIAMLAEYTTAGALFQSYIGSKTYPIIIMVGVLTMVYTAYGGLLVSIITDQVQGAASVMLFSILVVYVAVTFRYDLPQPMPCDPDDPLGLCISGTNVTGYSSIFTMPASLMVATVFSEAMWQRVWASDTKRSLRLGAWIACVGITLVVFFVGFCGLLAAWAGLITADTDPNLYLFQALSGAVNSDGLIANWIGVVTIVFAIIMNESAVDSFQNGLTAAISSQFLKDYPLLYTRGAVVLINIPIMVVATKGYTILQLFLLGNMICATAAAPVLMGLMESLQRLYGGGTFMFAFLMSFLSISIYGVHVRWDGTLSSSENLTAGMRYTWLENLYEWQYFLIPICVSIGAVLLGCAFNAALQRAHLASGWLFRVPGFTAPASHPDLPKYQATQPSEDEETSSHDKTVMETELPLTRPEESSMPQADTTAQLTHAA